MTAPPLPQTALTDEAARYAMQRLADLPSGSYRVVSCYLKLEPRDKTRGKYLIKMKNRVKEALTSLAKRPVERAAREAIAGDLERVLGYFEEPDRLPHARGIALFACSALGLFTVLPVPRVYRSRLAVEATPLVRELVALDQEFGAILVAACDRTGARFFEVTAFDTTELPGLTALLAARGNRFHGGRETMRGGHHLGTAIVAIEPRLGDEHPDGTPAGGEGGGRHQRRNRSRAARPSTARRARWS